MRLRDFWICSSKQSPANSFRLCLRAGCWHLKLRTKSRPVRYPSHPHSSLFALRIQRLLRTGKPIGFSPIPLVTLRIFFPPMKSMCLPSSTHIPSLSSLTNEYCNAPPRRLLPKTPRAPRDRSYRSGMISLTASRNSIDTSGIM